MTHTAEDIEAQFAAAISEKGYGVHIIPADGEWHAIAFPDSENGDKTGSAKLTLGKGGVVIDWRKKGEKPVFTWRPANGAKVKFTEEELEARAADAEHKAAKIKLQQEKVRVRELNLFASLPEATADHPYLKKKGIKDPGFLRRDKDALAVPIFSARSGEFQTVQRIRPDNMKLFPEGAAKAGGCVMPGSRGLDDLGRMNGGPLIICEGYATAYSIRRSTLNATIAALDCGNLLAVAKAMRDRFPLRDIIIAADNDTHHPDNPGVTHSHKAARAIGAKVAIPTSGFNDFNDLHLAEDAEAVKRAIQAAVEPPAARPVIRIEVGELSALADRGEAELRNAGVQFYQRAGTLVRPVIETVDAAHGRQTKVAQLTRIDPVYMRDVLSRVADWERYRLTKEEWAPTDPPPEVANTILARVGEWTFPAIAGVITTPTMRPDGTILDKPGYDPATRLLLIEPPPMPPVPAEPTKADAEKALALLEGLLIEFPFKDEIARSVGLSAMITPIVRGAYPVAPLHVGRAPVAASGKSYLFDTVAAIAIGQPMPVMAAGRTEEETEKRLGAALLSGQPLISIDNVNGELSGDALCQIIERPVVEVRILGRSEKVKIETRGTTLYANGNNIILVGDMCRRAITITLDPAVERPELRVFEGDPVAKVMADRGAFIAAALTIARAYVVAGRPQRAPRLASFEGWSDTVRSALIWLGKADPVASMELARAEDPELGALRDMLAAWAETIGTGWEYRCTLADVIKMIGETNMTSSGAPVPRWPALAAAVKAVAGGFVDAKAFGNWARGRKDRVVGDFRLVNTSDPKRGAEWWIENKDGKSAPGKAGRAGEM